MAKTFDTWPSYATEQSVPWTACRASASWFTRSASACALRWQALGRAAATRRQGNKHEEAGQATHQKIVTAWRAMSIRHRAHHWHLRAQRSAHEALGVCVENARVVRRIATTPSARLALVFGRRAVQAHTRGSARQILFRSFERLDAAAAAAVGVSPAVRRHAVAVATIGATDAGHRDPSEGL